MKVPISMNIICPKSSLNKSILTQQYMLNFLLDIAPDKSQLLLTIKLAGILREKKQEVYYTYTSNPAFTPVLYDKGISNCVLYPDDFRWLKPDLTLLDCRHAAHASLYRQLAIDYIFIAMQLPDQKNIQDKDISILYLPSTPYLSSVPDHVWKH